MRRLQGQRASKWNTPGAGIHHMAGINIRDLSRSTDLDSGALSK